jgi:alpha-ribazole phosphatase/probable phosphoglycerate mutase
VEKSATTSRILLLRHPETAWNREGRWQGHADLPLNERGWEQMREGFTRLPAEPWAAVYSSDLLRAQETAAWLGMKLGLSPRVTTSLRERNMGEWEGLTPAEALAGWPDLYPRVEDDPFRGRPPGGESFADLLGRVAPVLQRIAGFHPGEAALVVTHGGILKALVCVLLDMDFKRREELGLVNGVQVLFDVDGDRWTLVTPEPLAERQTRHVLHAEALR